MDRYWLLTWTTYGTWLPGDRRGFVSGVLDPQGKRVEHDDPGTEFDANIPGLQHYARMQMHASPVFLKVDQARILLAQFQETARYRKWELLAIAVMANHVHIVVGVPGDPDPSDLMRDFKSYGSRALNRTGKGAPERWWTISGSKRKLPNSGAVLSAVEYVRRQQKPLIVWIGERGGVSPPFSSPTGDQTGGQTGG